MINVKFAFQLELTYGCDVKVVSSFRILSGILENKFNFGDHVNSICSINNRKVFSIKKAILLSDMS